MRAKEFLPENAAASTTSAGSMAPVSQSLGSLISRTGFGKPAKYMNSFNPAKKRKRHVG
jgi:hypothetical protein